MHVCVRGSQQSVLQYSVLLAAWRVWFSLRYRYILSLPLYVKRVKTTQEFNLIPLTLLCQNWQVSDSLAEHLIIFQKHTKETEFLSSMSILNHLISPFHVAGSVQKESMFLRYLFWVSLCFCTTSVCSARNAFQSVSVATVSRFLY